MKKHILSLIPGVIILLLFSIFLSSPSQGADDSICARVKIEIRQELTLERQAFDAHMAINNGLSNITLENVQIDVTFSDQDGNAVLASTDPNNTNALFYIRIDSLKNITNVTGSGAVQPSSTADIHWLIIPAIGSSNGLEQGTLYYVGATLRYTIGGQENVTTVSPDYIFVKPMPQLALDYFIPSDVYGDDPFTVGVIEPTVPFSLGVRVKNTGAGIAKSLKIDSAQPKIVENDQGLLIGFNIEGTEVNGKTAANSLLADFGDILPKASAVSRWIMTCSLSGKFVQFDAQYSHSDELGGQLTSLMTDPITHFLVHDVLVDLPGRDGLRDFLAKDGAVYRLYESECLDAACNDSTVVDQSASSSLSLISQNGSEATYRLSLPVTAGSMIVRLADPFGGQKVIKEVIRSDGKRIKTDNAWLSKTRVHSDPWEYFFNLFDVNTTNSYTVVFTEAVGGPQTPVLQFIPDRTVIAGQQISFIVTASDPDGTIPLLSAAPLPALARFTDQATGTGIFDWTPTLGQAGVYSITYTASDGVLKNTRRATITVSTTGNNPPFVPSSPTPSNGADKIPVGANLSWVGGDPDPSDTVTYDVYLGNSNIPQTKVSSNQGSTSYSPSTLVYGTTYFWKIVARDNHGAETAGPVWNFTTLADTTPPSLIITSHSNGQHVTTASITLSGTASDSGNGDNGVQQVTVNGIRASNDTATGSGTANWSKAITLAAGGNTITVVTYDNSENHNTTTQTLTINVITCQDQPAKIVRTNTAYATLQEAYDAAWDGDTIQVSALTLTQTLTVNRNISVVLEGGYDCDSGTNTGNMTTLKGWIRTLAGGGSLTIKNFMVKPNVQAPTVTTGVVTNKTANAATITGTVRPNSAATTYYFEWGETSAYGTRNPLIPASAGSGSSDVAVSANLTGLTPNTPYHYRLVAENSEGISNGLDGFFTTPCLFLVSPITAIVASSSGEYSAKVTANTGCSWTAVSNEGWISIKTGAGGTGNGTVTYTVTANPGKDPRPGTLTIAGRTLTVEQAGAPCSYSLDVTSQSMGAWGGPGSVGVTAVSGCTWNAVSNASWVKITSGESGTGNGTVNYSVSANSGTMARSGTMTIAGQTFTVEQAQGPLTCAGFPVRNTNTGATYAGLQEAYDAALNGHTLQTQCTTLTGNLTVNRDIAVTVEGGYDCGFGYFSGINTILQGWIKTQPGGGTLTIKNFEVE